ncbi:MAG: lysophospholipid acyltransferase family protein [Eubacteriales bacterium]
MNALYWVSKHIASFINHCVFFIKVIGKENTDNLGRVMIVSNHVSWYDPVMMGGIFKRKIHYMAKAELFKTKPVKYFLSRMGAFPVKRGAGDYGALKKSFEILKADKCFGIFPEGTRFEEGKMGDFQRGAAAIALKMDAKIIPVYTKGTFKPFRQMKVIVGKAFSLKDRVNPKDKNAIDEGTKILKDALLQLKQELV